MPESNEPNAVSLPEVMDAFDMLGDEISGYVNRKTGEVFILHHDAFAGLQELESGSYGYPDEAMVALAKEIDICDSYKVLPDKFEIHEWQIMKDFCETVDDESERDQLLDAISGKGAFGRFKSAAYRLDRQDEWFAFRHTTLENMAIQWLDTQQFNWTRSPRPTT